MNCLGNAFSLSISREIFQCVSPRPGHEQERLGRKHAVLRERQGKSYKFAHGKFTQELAFYQPFDNKNCKRKRNLYRQNVMTLDMRKILASRKTVEALPLISVETG